MDFLSSLPIVGGFFDNSDQQAQQQLQNNQSLFQSLQTPNLRSYTPEQLQVLGNYDPTMMQAQTVQDDPAVKQAQMNVLNQMAGLSQTGLSDVDKAGFENARQIGNSVAASGNAAALQNAQARGVGGSGLEFAMREAANQNGAQNAQQAALQTAADAARQRALYTQAYGNALTGMRQEDFNNNATNANILNQFNQMNTQNANQAQLYNLQNNQGIYNQNVNNRNQAQQYNNNLRQQDYQNQYQRVAGMAGANTAMAGNYWNQNAANASNRNMNTALGFGIASQAGLFGGGKQGGGQGGSTMNLAEDTIPVGAEAMA